ncbi:cytochrome P450 family protein [Streptomyces sp. 8N706]|uniref:cytochrome P450 family protein n=1 Tax=Streptomyces sp. 8N706 TaxID=3457416 RepID=UPI003FD65060
MARCPVTPTFGDELVADPHSGYARLREADPVHRTATPDGAPVWLVTRYADVRAALADPRLSLNKANARTSNDYLASMPPELDAHLLNTDPPGHTRLRRLIATAFTPRRIDSLRERVQSITDDLLDAFAGPPVDLMAALANPLPMGVICELLGIPEGTRRDFRAWTNTLLSPLPGVASDSRTAMRQMHRFLLEIISDKRARRTDDLLSAMIEAHDEHDSLTEPELLAMAFLILFAGYDNAANLIGNATLALLTHPDHLRATREGTTTVRAVLEETLRWNTPSTLAARRFALEDLTIGGVGIRAGDRVWLSLISANRDATQFQDPDLFDPARSERTAGHLAFGRGIHSCLGASLARLEGEIAVTSLLRRFPTLELAVPADELQWWRNIHRRSLEKLPVTW